jgi:hypothetical protein
MAPEDLCSIYTSGLSTPWAFILHVTAADYLIKLQVTVVLLEISTSSPTVSMYKS